MMAASAPPDTHTLVLLQFTPNDRTSRTYLEHPSTSAAILDLISMFEHKLRQDQNSSSSSASTLKYTDIDVTNYIDAFPEIACLIRNPNPLPGGVSAYVPKDKEWIKQYVRPVLLQKLESMRATAATLAGSGAGANAAHVSTLASRMSMSGSSTPTAGQLQKQKQQPSKRQQSDSLSPPPPRASASSSSSKSSSNKSKKQQQQPTPKILIASTSNSGKITKRLGPDGAKANQVSTQLFTKAYAEKKGLAHVAKPLPVGAGGAGGQVAASGAKRGSGLGSGSGSGRRGGGGRR